ncbi:MAG: glycosyltransferase family 2 protein [Lachnospiraceae bacterium]|nr:glycosyltransferase family 2 protein [Lachnospiraceae bacterium]
MAKISLIIPCYNVEKYIDRCLQSVISQTIGLESLEIICVDDASTDHTLIRLQIWEQSYPEFIMLIPCSHNGRQGTARNIGLSYASSDWVAFLDADDWLEPDFFEKLYSITAKMDCDVVVSRMERDYSTELTYLENRSSDKDDQYMVIDTDEKRNYFILFNSMSNSACARLIRKSLLLDHQITFPENLAYEDTYWGSLLHLYTNKVYFLEEKLYHYFVNNNSTVLAGNLDYHTDLLTVQNMLWREWKERGFYPRYKDALEYDFLHSCYFSFLKILAFRYENPPYSLYQLLKELVEEKIGNCQDNPFLKEIQLPELYQLLLQSLSLSLTREEFQEFIRCIKSIGL